jgi:uncharacterized protein (TIGR04255 family)
LSLPKSIEVCPIVDALVEVRFLPAVPEEVVFGVLYESLAARFPKVENLPVLQVPPQIRNLNPQLRFQPTHRLKGERHYVSIGPRVVVAGIEIPYPGWDALRAQLLSTFEAIMAKHVIKQVQRLGFRYLNVFEGDVTKRLTLEFRLRDEVIEGDKTSFRTTMKREDANVTLRVSKDQNFKRPPNFKRTGTIIDIDVSRATSDVFTLQTLISFIDAAHTTEKTLFFDLLKPEFLTDLKPTF